ncbi:MAG: ATP-binding protein [Thermodesulfovibrionales bacterium]|nr:ATP-binding protein [Thermodesulfovibrionales bacterium]
MRQSEFYKTRWIAEKLRNAIDFFPVIILSGARQTGKSTLLQNEMPFKDWHYITFDDLDVLDIAIKRPDEILNISSNLVIDEVQRAPEFLYSVKRAIDRDRDRRIVLSGSAKLLLMKGVSESLAGRAVYLDLMPFSIGELFDKKYSGWLEGFINTGRLDTNKITYYESRDIQESLFRGFLPPVTFLKNSEHITEWWRGYIKTYLERDLRQFAEISYLSDFKRMMQLLALRTANILKQSDISRDAGLSHSTTGRYISILEETGLFTRLMPYSKNISKRLIKSPKVFLLDTGLICSLSGFSTIEAIPEGFKGAMFESLVFLNLSVIASLMSADVMYFRTQGGKEREVDFIIEKGNKIIGIEVKLSDSVSIKDIENLLFLKDETKAFAGGLVIYTGSEIKQLASNIYAVPYLSLC